MVCDICCRSESFLIVPSTWLKNNSITGASLLHSRKNNKYINYEMAQILLIKIFQTINLNLKQKKH